MQSTQVGESSSQATKKYTKKIRIWVSDPDATDSSSEEECKTNGRSSSKKLVEAITIGAGQTERVTNKMVTNGFADNSRNISTRFANPTTNGAPHYIGVRRRKWGRFVAEVRDKKMKQRVWLGTFDTAEEAADAYDRAATQLNGPNVKTNFKVVDLEDKVDSGKTEKKRVTKGRSYIGNHKHEGVCLVQKEGKSKNSELDYKLSDKTPQEKINVDSPGIYKCVLPGVLDEFGPLKSQPSEECDLKSFFTDCGEFFTTSSNVYTKNFIDQTEGRIVDGKDDADVLSNDLGEFSENIEDYFRDIMSHYN